MPFTNQAERVSSLALRWHRNYPEVEFRVVCGENFIDVRLRFPDTTMRGQISYLLRDLHIVSDDALYFQLAVRLSYLFNTMRERLKERGYDV